MAIPQGFIQDLLARADIVDVVGRYVTLKKAGINFKGLCPFHGEKTPSFSVSPVRQVYHCFGCGEHGDAIRFLMEHNGLSFVEAVTDLAQHLGLTVPDENVSPQEKAIASQRKAKQTQLTDVLAKAAQHWQTTLLQNKRAVDYVQRRGLTQETVSRFSIGYALPGWQGLAQVFANYEDPLLVESGLVIAHEASSDVSGHSNATTGEKRYDRFRDRIMFPIRNVKGEVIGFGGRVLDKGEPKYLNSPETPVFSKGHELYGLYEARGEIRQHGYLLVTEGYMDVVALAQNGFTNAVATLGTACTAEHIQKIFKFTESVVFSFDGDSAGRKAARRALEAALPQAKDTRSIKFLFLPPEHDPDSYIQMHGHDGFAQAAAQALPLSQFLLEAAREGCDLATPEGRARMLAQAYPLWSLMPAKGALGIQLLAEIAVAGQMSTESLQTLWSQQLAATTVSHYPQVSDSQAPYEHNFTFESSSYWQQPQEVPSYSTTRKWEGAKSTGKWGENWSEKGRGKWGKRGKRAESDFVSTRPARAPLTPLEHCMRMLLIHSEWWEKMPGADQELLCQQGGWQGAFFQWLDRVVVDRGAMNWPALSECARSQPWFDMMIGLMGGVIEGVDVQLEELQICLDKLRTAKQREESQRILQQFKGRG